MLKAKNYDLGTIVCASVSKYCEFHQFCLYLYYNIYTQKSIKMFLDLYN